MVRGPGQSALAIAQPRGGGAAGRRTTASATFAALSWREAGDRPLEPFVSFEFHLGTVGSATYSPWRQA